jgi:hypothetical protein
MLAWEGRQKRPDVKAIEHFLSNPPALRVVCTPTDIVLHQEVKLC